MRGNYEAQYLELLSRVMREGTQQSNRTGVDTRFLPGAMLQFDLREGFPALTTKKLAFKQVVGELLGFIRGYTSNSETTIAIRQFKHQWPSDELSVSTPTTKGGRYV